ncbi:TPA: hypothetical protein U1366_000034 [Streptococcus suis]|nr:hypothetical protein [Streptococcus suis]
MFNQHLYTRSNIRMGGFQTIAHSGLPNDVLSILEKNAKYLSQQGINELDFKPKIRYSFTEKDTFVTGQSVYGLSDGRMAPLTHNFTTQIDSLDCSNLDHFAGNLHFIERFVDESEVDLQPSFLGVESHFDLQNFILENPYGIDQSLLSNIVIDLLKVIDEKKGRKIYLSLDVPIENQTDAALAIMQAIYSLLPARVRPLVGYNTFFMGDINNELYHPNIQLYFVPRHILNAAKRIYGKKVNVDIIYAVESKYFDKINQDTFEFQELWKGSSESLANFYDLFAAVNQEESLDDCPDKDSLSKFYALFDAVIGEEAIGQYGYLGCLERLYPSFYSLKDCPHEEVVAYISSQIDFISSWMNSHHAFPSILSIRIALLHYDYYKYLDRNGLVPDQSLITIFIQEMDRGTLSKEDVIDLLDLGLRKAKDDIQAIIKIVSATKGNLNLYHQLFSSSIVNNDSLLRTYLTYELGKPTTLDSLFKRLLEIHHSIGDSKQEGPIENILWSLSKSIHREFALSELNEELAQRVASSKILKWYYREFLEAKLSNLKNLMMEDLPLATLESFIILPLNYSKECQHTLDSIVELQSLHSSLPQWQLGEVEDFVRRARHIDKYSDYLRHLYGYYTEKDSELSYKYNYLLTLLDKKTMTEFVDTFLSAGSFDNYLHRLEWLSDFMGDGEGIFDSVVTTFQKRYLTNLSAAIDFVDILNNYKGFFGLASRDIMNYHHSFILDLEMRNKLSLKEKAELKFNREYQKYKKEMNEEKEVMGPNPKKNRENENSRKSRSRKEKSNFFGFSFGKKDR